MIVLRPDYYEQFTCIASACPDSCCIGWKIEVDQLSFKKYRQVKGEFGKYLNSHVDKERKDSTYKSYASICLDEQNRCSFLDSNNLCEIYKNLGEKYLCNTCKQYPRYIYRFDDRYEITLTISCPEIARLIIEHKEPITFTATEVEEAPYKVENMMDNRALHDILWDVRELLIDIAQNRNLPTWKRMVFIKQAIGKVLQSIEDESYSIQTLEVLRAYTENEKSAQIIDKAGRDRIGKRELIKDILEYRKNLGIQNELFTRQVDMYLKFFEDITESNEELTALEDEFETYMQTYDYIMENYAVYYLFANVMTTLWTLEIQKEIDLLIINYVLIKYFLFIVWKNKGKTLTLQDFIQVIYSFSRGMEHNFDYKDGIYEVFQKSNLVQMANLVELLA